MGALRGTLVLTIMAGVVALTGGPDAPRTVGMRGGPPSPEAIYSPQEKEHYLSTQDFSYIRPGFNIKVNSVTIGADSKPVVDLTFTDDLGQPLDRAGQVTPGALSVSFVIAWYDPATTDYTSYISRVATAAPPSTMVGNKATQATADSGGVWTDLAIGHATYKFGNALPAGYDKTKTTTVGMYATRNTTAIVGKNYFANAEYDFRPDAQPVTAQWDLIRNSACNTCHDPLSAHGGSRQDVKLCVLCHNPGSTDPDTGNTVDFKVMIHKIHDGSSLPSVAGGKPYQIIGFNQSVNDYSTVVFPQDIKNCTTCHAAPAAGADVWTTNPSRAICASCHDNIDWTTGLNHEGGIQIDDKSCVNCHEALQDAEFDASVQGAHTVQYKSTQLHGLVMKILSVTQTGPGQKPVVSFQVLDKNGVSIDPRPFDTLQFTMGGATTDYSALPISENAQATTTFDGTNATYTFQNPIPANAVGTWAVTCDVEWTVPLKRGDGHPDITDFTESPMNPVFYIAVTDKQPVPRRMVVDVGDCNKCHDHLGAHGGRRLNTQGCIICHNPTNDDSSQRPAANNPPESIAFQRMIHRIHTGDNLTQDFTIYGHGGRKVNFNDIRFPGDRRDCVKCHVPGSYTMPDIPPDGRLATTTLRDFFSPMQPSTAACLGCHDDRSPAAHAYTNATQFGEACAACHGNDGQFSVDKIHAR